MKFAALLLFTASAWAQNWPSNCVMDTTGWVKCPIVSGPAIVLPVGNAPPSPTSTGSPAAPSLPTAGTPPAVTSSTAGGSSVWVGAGLFQGQHHLEPMGIGAIPLGKNTWSFNTVEFQGVQRHPFAVLTSVETGVAQRLTTVSGIGVYAILGAGAAATGSTAGGSFAGGFLAMAPVGKGWTAGLFARVQQTTGTLAASSVTLGIVIGAGK